MLARMRGMRDKAILCAAIAALGGLVRCSGDDSSNADAGNDAAVTPDVVADYAVQETAPPKPSLVDVAAGAQHTCAVVSYGGQYATYCFGADAELGGTKSGVLAVASTGVSPAPALVSIASGFGASHTCGIDASKKVWCWGDDSLGQCGQGNPSANVASPSPALDFQLSVAKATSIAVGTSSTCMIRNADGKLACFGDNAKCEADLWDTGGCSAGTTSAVVTTDSDVVFQTPTVVALGAAHGCAAASPVPSGSPALFCFGDNASLESGPSGKTITTPAATIASPRKVVSVAAGDAHTCFVTDAPHELDCFGKNDVHQASPTSASATIDPSAPAVVTLPQSAVPLMVAARAGETCVVDVSGALYCFGQGHGANVDPISGVKDVAKVALGGAHTCVIGHLPSAALSDPAQLICWGDDTNGQAGQTAGTSVATPTAVAIPDAAPN